MPKLDPYSLPRPKRPAETRTFILDGEEYPLTLTLRRLTFADDAAAEDEVNSLKETYLTGSDLRGPAPFPDPDVTPSETLFRTAARIRRMQCPEDPADAYDTMELLFLSGRQPNNYKALCLWANTIERGTDESQGESHGLRMAS